MVNIEFMSRKLETEELKKAWSELSGIRFSGFLRYSNSEFPVILNDEPLPELSFTDDSYLFETAVYADGRLSISIRQFNDFWIWNQTSWKEFPPDQSSGDCDYLISMQMIKCPEGFRKMKFYTQYLPETEGKFTELKPAWTAFIGFAKGE